ncbi:MAG: poly-gamma-glutamate synthase PgsB [Myxococcota bacterium]
MTVEICLSAAASLNSSALVAAGLVFRDASGRCEKGRLFLGDLLYRAPMTSLILLATVAALLVGLGIVERWQHHRRLRQIPIRIHVNGTRGKSSVTRLIAAGLRAGGIRTCAKTTGTLARMILPDGREFPVFRPAKANVIEQLRIVRASAELETQALVIECMAVQPLLQSLCELVFVRATHGVITNARPDHLDVMGPTSHDVATALAATVPVQGKIYTSEPEHIGVFEAAAEDRKSKLHRVTPQDISAVTESELSNFSYLEHAENVATALAVCGDLGVDRATALKGMWQATPDPGALTAYELSFFGRTVVFVNAFAANDPDSTAKIWRWVRPRFEDFPKTIIIVNCRADRPDRSQQLARLAGQSLNPDHFVLMGEGSYIFSKTATDAGLEPHRIHYAEGLNVEEVFEVVADLTGPRALVMGIANIGGQGLELVRFFRNRSKPLVWAIGEEHK